MIETIYIARHGFRMNWVNSTWKSVTGLPRDPPWPSLAFRKPKSSQIFFDSPRGPAAYCIFSSPYIAAYKRPSPWPRPSAFDIVEHGISEWYSPVAPNTGLHPRPGSAASLRAYFPEIDPDGWSSVWYPPRVGEDVAEVHTRTAASSTPTTIALARALVGEPALPLRVGCCSLTEVVRKRDVIPILGGPSRDWGFEDIEIADGKVVEDPGVPGTELEKDDLVGLQVALTSNL
ncbi:hypothetical protein K438DRAFT_1954830 [Mycena galopus ATCC 62051]|nr:hypothetical protein K438DRAFT_1954830 [Mycena galopus ATCC 62051]